jgi:ribosome-binding protein aMBF1 (putative translation factor)
MILKMKSLNESLPLTANSDYPEFKRYIAESPKSSGQVITIESAYVHAPLPSCYKEIDTLIKDREKNSTRSKALSKARERLAATLNSSEEVNLSILRLRAGLSQYLLAEKIGNSQPSYSKIEAGRTEIMFSTFEKLVEVLGVSRDELSLAIKNTQKEAK